MLQLTQISDGILDLERSSARLKFLAQLRALRPIYIPDDLDIWVDR